MIITNTGVNLQCHCTRYQVNLRYAEIIFFKLKNVGLDRWVGQVGGSGEILHEDGYATTGIEKFVVSKPANLGDLSELHHVFQSGRWTMHVVNRMSITPVSVSGLVLSRGNRNGTIWISTSLRDTLAMRRTPQFIRAEVKKGTGKVTGVNVTARVTSSNMPPIDIQLVEQRAGNFNPLHNLTYIGLGKKRCHKLS